MKNLIAAQAMGYLLALLGADSAHDGHLGP
jgi:hypothetical protein